MVDKYNNFFSFFDIFVIVTRKYLSYRDIVNRDIQDQVEKGVLLDAGEGGRSTNYILSLPTL